MVDVTPFFKRNRLPYEPDKDHSKLCQKLFSILKELEHRIEQCKTGVLEQVPDEEFLAS